MLSMRDTARGIFQYALAESSISKAFARHVNCERGILRVREDLYDLTPTRGSSSFRSAKPDTRW